MRVMLITPNLEVGGSELLTIGYAAGLIARGHDAVIAFGEDDFQLPRARERGVPVVRLTDTPLTSRSLAHWTRVLRRAVRAYRPDVIHAQSVKAAMAAAAGAPFVPRLVTLHGVSSDDEAVAAAGLRASRSRVTAVSEAAAKGILRFGWAPPVEVLPTGIDVRSVVDAAAEPVPVALPSPPVIACVARQTEQKGIDVLLHALAAGGGPLSEASLVLVGDGVERAANEDLSRRLGLRERVLFAGNQMNPAAFLRAADVVVLPSRWEGLPLVVLEALALARPLVATAVGGTPVVVRDGETGWLVPPEDPGALAAALTAALSDPAEGARRGAAGAVLVRDRYELSATVDRVEEILIEISGAAAPPRPSRVPPLKPRPYYRATSAVEGLRVRRALAHSSAPPSGHGLRVLGYHRIADDDDVLAVRRDAFAWQMEEVLRSGAQVLRLTDAVRRMRAGEQPGDWVCVTFDDGYRDTLEDAVPVLERLGLPGTLFLPSGLLSDRPVPFYWYRGTPPPALSPEEIHRIAHGGVVDVQSHSRTHPRLTALTDDEAVSEIAGSRDDIARALGVEVTVFSYPAGLYGPRDAEIATTAYAAAVTTRSGLSTSATSPWELNRTMITWADDRARFRAKLSGRLDRPGLLTELAQRRRAGSARPVRG